jgi:hypothetical protein
MTASEAVSDRDSACDGLTTDPQPCVPYKRTIFIDKFRLQGGCHSVYFGDKPIVTQLVNEFPAYYEIKKKYNKSGQSSRSS